MHASALRILPLISLLFWSPLYGQIPYEVGELQLALKKLTVLGSVLYISAHPDDENTAFLATMAKMYHLRTGYLSLTRGEGGQNLIGPEQGSALGLIRTQELLQARRIDGAEQYFTRAIDFGYSKTTEETLRYWGREEILSDIVWVIRSFRPDIIVTRFTPQRGGHGNHTASAVLAYEAFRAAADSTRFPEQLQRVRPWHARRIVWNVFRFSRDRGDEPQGAFVTVDLGQYCPLLGLSMGEVAGRSRSMHRSQGFGTVESRGSWTNSFQHVDGDTALNTLTDGVDLSWNRIKGGKEVGRLLQQASASFDHRRPTSVLPLLLRAEHLMGHLSDDPWVRVKRQELHDAILGASGLWINAVADVAQATPGSTLGVTTTVLNRSSLDVRLEEIAMTYAFHDSLVEQRATPDVPLAVRLQVLLPDTLEASQPYWLRLPPSQGRYTVDDQSLIGQAQNPPVLRADVALRIQDQRLVVTVPVRYQWVDPARGELHRPVVIVPPVSVSLREAVVPSRGQSGADVTVVVSNAVPGFRGSVALALPPGWTAVPESQDVVFDSTLSERTLIFRVSPGAGAPDGWLTASVDSPAGRFDRTLHVIAYEHIEPQILLEAAQARLLHLNLHAGTGRIGYIQGSGDEIAGILKQLGYSVRLLSDDDLEGGSLEGFDAIIAGVRAYNVRPALQRAQGRLMDYVRAGGRYIVQYVTQQDLALQSLGPYPFSISRDRVSVEDAPVTLLEPEHPLLQQPNVVSAADFQGWVQERGLYFADKWDPRYETPLSSHDPGEEPHAGGLLFARYGKGYYVYTGYAWFRQLPAGVPGAFRLFVNLLSQPVDLP